MTRIAIKAPLPYRAYTAARAYAEYGAFAATHSGAFLGTAPPEDQRINDLLEGYPSNHFYRVHAKQLIPGREIYERLGKVTPLLSENLESFLDIGCCKGYYTSLVAQKETCKVSAGIDVRTNFIETSKQVSDYLGLSNTQYHLTTLDKVAEAPANFGGPYQTILLIGTYHYLFWGSGACKHCFRSHEEILSQLAKLCTDRVIISGRFEVNRLPRNIRETAMASKEASQYSTEQFVIAARKFFTVEEHGFLGEYPLLVLKKRKVK